MKKLLVSSHGKHLARLLKAVSVLLIGLGLATAFWVASTPAAQAQNTSPARMIESQLPQGKTAQNASKADYLAAVCAAVKKFRSAAPQIVRAAITAHPEWKRDLLRTAFNCLGTDDCRLLGRVLRNAIEASAGDANELTQLAIEIAPGCSSSFGGGTAPDEGNFGIGPGNQNPPPGTITGGGGQGNVVAVCHNGHTIFLSPQAAEDDLRNNPGDTLGPCQVTAVTNQ